MPDGSVALQPCGTEPVGLSKHMLCAPLCEDRMVRSSRKIQGPNQSVPCQWPLDFKGKAAPTDSVHQQRGGQTSRSLCVRTNGYGILRGYLSHLFSHFETLATHFHH